MTQELAPHSMPTGPVAEVLCRDVLFAHWPVEPSQLQENVPAELSIDTFGDNAWLSVLVVDIPEARVRNVPYHPSLVSINVRTYVSYNDEPGVYFISLEMDGQTSAWVARNGFGLPYHHAEISLEHNDGEVKVSSHRKGQSAQPAQFVAKYSPAVNEVPTEASQDTLEAFLIERTNYFFTGGPQLRDVATIMGTIENDRDQRYRLSSAKNASSENSSLFAGAAKHKPWSLLPVEATITSNTLFDAAGIPNPEESPIFHYSRQQHMAAARLRDLSASSSGR